MSTRNELTKLLKDQRTKPFAVLCGAGISFDAGLPTWGSIRDLVLAHAPDERADLLLRELLDRSSADRPQLRFEGFLEVLQQTVDPELHVLDAWRLGTPTCAHKALAKVAETKPVITTNFDSLIERASNGKITPK